MPYREGFPRSSWYPFVTFGGNMGTSESALDWSGIGVSGRYLWRHSKIALVAAIESRGPLAGSTQEAFPVGTDGDTGRTLGRMLRYCRKVAAPMVVWLSLRWRSVYLKRPWNDKGLLDGLGFSQYSCFSTCQGFNEWFDLQVAMSIGAGEYVAESFTSKNNAIRLGRGPAGCFA